jgi:amino acid transporter
LTTPSLALEPRTGIGRELVQLPRERRLNLISLLWLIFFTTCGGAFGLEPLIGAVGPTLALLLILITPFVWSLPTALMTAELTALIPEEGGYYVWIRRAFGPFWAVQQACWIMATSVVWLAMFPVLFVSYLTFLFPAITPAPGSPHHQWSAIICWMLAAVVIACGAALNSRGARDVGRSANVSAYFVLGAFVVLLLVWLKRSPAPDPIFEVLRSDRGISNKGALLLGLSYITFNTSGWDNASTYAGEVNEAQRSYPRALICAVLILILCYVFPVIAGVTVTTDPSVWSAAAGWPAVAAAIGGRWLGSLLALAGMVSTFGLFSAQLLYVSRLPLVLASDGWLPGMFAKVSAETPAPRLSILTFAAFAAVFAALSFGSLAIIQCVLYTACLTFEFLALLVLRVRYPDSQRSFKVPGSWLGLAYVCMAPFAFAVVLLYATLREWRNFPGQLFVIGAVVSGGMVLYLFRRKTAAT